MRFAKNQDEQGFGSNRVMPAYRNLEFKQNNKDKPKTAESSHHE
jgi:hypothetical protein